MSKGFTRLAFGALKKKPELKVMIVPVGLNYEDHQGFRKGVSIYFGKPISASEFYQKGEEHVSAMKLKESVSKALKKLTTHVEDVENYDEVVETLKARKTDFLDPIKVNGLLETWTKGRDESTRDIPAIKVNYIFDVFKFLATLINFIPLQVWKFFSKKLKDPVMVGTFRFGVGITVFPVYYFLLSFTLGLLLGPGGGIISLLFLPFSILILKRYF